jgi:hypothetical protein
MRTRPSATQAVPQNSSAARRSTTIGTAASGGLRTAVACGHTDAQATDDDSRGAPVTWSRHDDDVLPLLDPIRIFGNPK